MDELLFGRIRMHIPDAQFRVSTDSMVLADFCRIRPGSRVLDLGCGCGTLGLLLLGKDPSVTVTGIELQAAAAAQAQENAQENGFSDRFRVVCGDLRQAHAAVPAGSFDCALSNPPYFPPACGKASAARSACIARSELYCPPDALCAAAARALRWGGRFFLVHKPERLVDLLTCLRQARLEPKRLCFVRHSPGHPPSLVLIESCLGGRPGLQYAPELLLHEQDGSESAACRRIYHRQE